MTVTSQQAYEFGPYRFEPVEARLLRQGEPVHLPPKALEVLATLVKRSGHVVTKEALLAEVWPGTFVEEGVLAVNMSTLRKVLDVDPGQVYIETVPRRGYRFIAPVRHLPTTAPHEDLKPPEGSPQEERESLRAVRGPSWLRDKRLAWVATPLVLALGVPAYLTIRAPRSTSSAVSSLVVVPFRAIGAAGDQGHLELGMADAVVTRLGTLQQLSVPPTAAIRPNEDPFEAAARLKVDAVLTGSIQRSGDRIRVVAQLSRASDRTQIWASRFDAAFTDIFDVQDGLAERIATNLLRGVSVRDRMALHRRETSNVDAYELYLKGRERSARATADSVRTAIQMYQEAIRLDPRFALAFTGLADAYASAASGLAPKARYPLAKAAAERALALDPLLVEAHASRSLVAYKADWDWNLAERELRRALELGANNARVRRMYGQFLTLRGSFDAAILELRRALALDPYSLNTRSDLEALLAHAGQLAEARAIVEMGLSQDPHAWLMHRSLAHVLAAEGRDAESVEADLEARRLAGDPAAQIDELREAYRRGGRTGYLRRQNELLMARLTTAATGDALALSIYGAATSLALNFAALGDREQTMRWLMAAADRGEEGPLYLNFWEFDAVRDDPRFKALYRRVFGTK